MISIRTKEFQQAMKELGVLYGVKDQNSFVQLLLTGTVDDDKAAADQIDQINNGTNNELSKLVILPPKVNSTLQFLLGFKE